MLSVSKTLENGFVMGIENGKTRVRLKKLLMMMWLFGGFLWAWQYYALSSTIFVYTSV